jgi:hypothetical protein
MRWIILLLLFSSTAFAGDTINPMTGDLDACITVEEEDGSPSNYTCDTLKLSNGSMTDNGDGTFSISTGGGGGSGDVTAVGDCASGDCLDGTSDGGTAIQLYNSGAGESYIYFISSGEASPTFFKFDGTNLELWVTNIMRERWLGETKQLTASAGNNIIASTGNNITIP